MPDAAATAASPPRDKVVAIWTRRLDGEPMAGRLRIAHAVRAALSEQFDLVSFEIPSVAGALSVRRTFEAGLALLGSLLRGRPLPLQCTLFAASSDLDTLIALIPGDAKAVYLDGVRCYVLLERLRKARPQLRIVADLDDLMSRRMSLLLGAREPLSPGYLTRQLPRLLRWLVASPLLGRLVVRYEGATLKGVETRILNLADVVSLLSMVDTASLHTLAGTGPRRAKIVAIPAPATSPLPTPFLGAPIRFVFLGSDALTQNRLTIDYLIELWRREAIKTPLVIYGLQLRLIDAPPHISVPGYAKTLGEVYDGRSVLLTPSFLGGGVKTKVLEALANGAPVIGNARTFEAIPVPDYPLCLEDEADLLALLREPDRHVELFERAIAIGLAYVAGAHDPERFAASWRAVLSGREPPQAALA